MNIPSFENESSFQIRNKQKHCFKMSPHFTYLLQTNPRLKMSPHFELMTSLFISHILIILSFENESSFLNLIALCRFLRMLVALVAQASLKLSKPSKPYSNDVPNLPGYVVVRTLGLPPPISPEER